MATCDRSEYEGEIEGPGTDMLTEEEILALLAPTPKDRSEDMLTLLRDF
jgi:hypothetical protein